jgi:kynureninase
MIPLMASLELYEKAGMENIRNKGIRLTGYLEFLIKIDLPEVSIITPNNKGSQLSISIKKGRQVFDRLIEEGLICDWREPDVIRLAPHPLFNTFQEVFNTVKLIRDVLNE